MSSYATIELERTQDYGRVPTELDPESQYVYGQSFYGTWSILDYIAEINGWQPLSSFCAVEDSDCNLEDEWYDSKLGLESVSGLLNKFISLIGMGALTFIPNEYQRYDVKPDNSELSKEEALLIKAIKNEQLFNYAFWDLRAYELILRRAIENGERFRIVVG
jgi:hypothetical protein